MENPALFCAHTGANANTPQIRPAGSQDSEAIARMAHAADMGELSEAGVTYVAEVDGAVVGFIRLVEEDGSWFVNPVVIESARRGRGIGRALMRFARQRKGPLRFVARGYAVPFYQKLGCTTIPWSEIPASLASDCDACDMLATCFPQPMILK